MFRWNVLNLKPRSFSISLAARLWKRARPRALCVVPPFGFSPRPAACVRCAESVSACARAPPKSPMADASEGAAATTTTTTRLAASKSAAPGDMLSAGPAAAPPTRLTTAKSSGAVLETAKVGGRSKTRRRKSSPAALVPDGATPEITVVIPLEDPVVQTTRSAFEPAKTAAVRIDQFYSPALEVRARAEEQRRGAVKREKRAVHEKGAGAREEGARRTRGKGANRAKERGRGRSRANGRRNKSKGKKGRPWRCAPRSVSYPRALRLVSSFVSSFPCAVPLASLP